VTAGASSVFARNDELREVLRRAASALKEPGPDFAAAFLMLTDRLGITD
jgi:hypothetical protein